MGSIQRDARFAGWVYLLAGVSAPFGMAYVPGKLIVRGDATATAEKILASESLFRLGMMGELVAAVGFLFVAFALYRLLAGVDRRKAAMMVTLYALSIPISFVGLAEEAVALNLLRGSGFASTLGRDHLQSLAMLLLDLHRQGLLLAEIFWGLWLLPFGILVLRSGFLPRFLGAWLLVNGFAYVALSLTGLMLPPRHEALFRLLLPALLGEMAIMLWLLIRGARGGPGAGSQPSIATSTR